MQEPIRCLRTYSIGLHATARGRRPAVQWELVTASVVIGREHLATALPALADEGVRALEVWMNSSSHFDATSAADVDELRTTMDAHGLWAYSTHAPFGEQLDISALHEDARGGAVGAHCAAIHASRALGAELIVVHPGTTAPSADERPARLRAVIESVKALAAVADRCGVRVAIENMIPDALGGSAEDVAHIVDAVGAAHVGVCLDTGHAHLGEGVTTAAATLAERIIAIHLDDNDGSSDQHILPSKGAIDWHAAAAALRQLNYQAPICVESGRWEELTIREMYEVVRTALA